MWPFTKPKLCKNCKHFDKTNIVYGVQVGNCHEVAGVSKSYAGDLVFTDGNVYSPDPLKVGGNFGCIRFERKKHDH